MIVPHSIIKVKVFAEISLLFIFSREFYQHLFSIYTHFTILKYRGYTIYNIEEMITMGIRDSPKGKKLE